MTQTPSDLIRVISNYSKPNYIYYVRTTYNVEFRNLVTDALVYETSVDDTWYTTQLEFIESFVKNIRLEYINFEDKYQDLPSNFKETIRDYGLNFRKEYINKTLAIRVYVNDVNVERYLNCTNQQTTNLNLQMDRYYYLRGDKLKIRSKSKF